MKLYYFTQQRSKFMFFRLILIISSVFLLASQFISSKAFAAQATLAWNASANPDGTAQTNLGGYKIYVGPSSGSYVQNVDVGNQTSYTLTNLDDGTTQYFAVTAYDTAGGESGFSNQVSKTFTAAPVTYQITATAGSGGSIATSSNVVVNQATNGTSTINSITVVQGSSVTLSITPKTGYKIVGITVDGVSVGAVSTYTFSGVAANHTIAASFAVANYSISASAGTGGTISPAGTTSVNYGNSQTFTVASNAGYKIADVKVNGVSVGAVGSYTLSNINANHTIAASFAITSYSISASAGVGGSITPAGTASVNYGTSQTFTIAPSTGYNVVEIKVDGVSVGAVLSYTFNNVTSNHTILASFATKTGQTIFATNCGGAQFADSTGVTYNSDNSYSGGSASSTTTAISGTADDKLYQSWRSGALSYSIPVANGNYSVTLKFSDNVNAAGMRIFDVLMEGTKVVSRLDIVGKVGKNTAYDVTIPVTVTDKVLNINFANIIGYAKVNAINVKTR